MLMLQDVCKNQVLKDLEATFNKQKEELAVNGNRTVKLWMQYINMVGIVQRFLWAEIFGLCKEHLRVAKSVIPYLLATSHNKCVKTERICFQKLDKLSVYQPKIYKSFCDDCLPMIKRGISVGDGTTKFQ